jgi:sugar lactone lactonase YvrE
MKRRGRVLARDLIFPEGPRWHEGAFWFSDMHAKTVCRIDSKGHRSVVAEVPGSPSGLGWLPDGRMLVVSMQDQRLLRLEPDGSLVEVADLSKWTTHLCNDMVVDHAGRAYVGNFGFDLHAGDPIRTTNLIRVDPSGDAQQVADGLAFPNGAVITPDGRTLIVGETFGARLAAFDIQPDGSLENHRLWASVPGVAPDGICLDAEGAVWVASPISAEVVRVREGGEIIDRLPVDTQAFACMLGGETGHTLFVCTARSSDPETCKQERAGRIETFEVGVPHAGLP